jgi:hypothetical protein
MADRVVVPDNIKSLYSPEQVADVPRYGYGPNTNPRPLNPGEDAQRILDGVINNSGIPGIPERVAYDGGFRVGRGDPSAQSAKQSYRVTKTLEATAAHYVGLAGKTNDPSKASGYLKTSQQILNAEDTYLKTRDNYWKQIAARIGNDSTTPKDVVTTSPSKGETLLGENGLPIPKAVGQ